MTEVNTNNQLLEQAPGFRLHQRTVMGCVVALDKVHQIASGCVLTHNGQIVSSEKDLLKLDDVGVHTAQSLIQDFPPCCLDAASQHLHCRHGHSLAPSLKKFVCKSALVTCTGVTGEIHEAHYNVLCLSKTFFHKQQHGKQHPKHVHLRQLCGARNYFAL